MYVVVRVGLAALENTSVTMSSTVSEPALKVTVALPNASVLPAMGVPLMGLEGAVDEATVNTKATEAGPLVTVAVIWVFFGGV